MAFICRVPVQRQGLKLGVDATPILYVVGNQSYLSHMEMKRIGKQALC